jgi:transcriptional regulator with XRE-family HTH domain
MHFQELGYKIRRGRLARGMSQATLAKAAGISRVTLNQLENGSFADLGVRKVQRILDKLGLELAVQPARPKTRPDFVQVARTVANVSFKHELSDEELIRALLKGVPPADRRPHLRALLDEARPAVLKGLVEEVSRWTKPGKVERNLAKIADEIGSTRKVADWLKKS